MNLENRLNASFNDILRTAGYFFEALNTNRKQSNLITGTNNHIVPAQITTLFTSNIGQFEQILDETVSKLDDAAWCIGQIVENKKRQDELKVQEELERQKLAEDERLRQEREAVARKKEAQEKEQRLAKEKLEHEERLAKEKLEHEERLAKEKLEHEERLAKEKREREQCKEKQHPTDDSDFKTNFNGDLDMEKELGFEIPNPSDILSSISYKEGERSGTNVSDENSKLDNMDLDANLGPDMMDDLGMDLLGRNFDGSLGDDLDEEFDVDNFLNQFGNGE